MWRQKPAPTAGSAGLRGSPLPLSLWVTVTEYPCLGVLSGKQKCVAPISEGCWSTIRVPVPSCCLLPVASLVAGGGGGRVSGAPREALIPFSGHHLPGFSPSQRPCPQQHHLWGSGLQYELWRHTDFQTITTPTPGRASSPWGRRSESRHPRFLPLQGAPRPPPPPRSQGLVFTLGGRPSGGRVEQWQQQHWQRRRGLQETLSGVWVVGQPSLPGS